MLLACVPQGTQHSSRLAIRAPRRSRCDTVLADQGTKARELLAGTVASGELAAGETHVFEIALASGQYLEAWVSQPEVDLVVRVRGTEGEGVDEFDSREQDREPVCFVANTSGTYRLEVAPLEKGPARYEIGMESLRPAVPEDETRIAALRSATEAKRLRAEGSAESQRRATGALLRAMPLWRSLGDRAAEAEALLTLGSIHAHLAEHREALSYYQEALALWRALGDQRREAATLSGTGVVYWSLGEHRKALDHYQAALALARITGDADTEGRALNNLGLAHWSLGEHSKALESYDRALALWRQRGNRKEQARTLNNLGLVRWSLSELQEALEAFRESLPIRQAVGDRAGQAVTLHNIGILFYTLGDLDGALAHFRPALELRRLVGDRRGEAKTLHNIGEVYDTLGDKTKALEYYAQALPLRRAVGDRSGLALTLQSIGEIHGAQGETEKALGYLDEGLILSRDVGDPYAEAMTLQGMGVAYAAAREWDKALRHHEEALRIWRVVGDRLGEAHALYRVASLYRGQGNLLEARSRVEEALGIVEGVRGKVSSQGMRAAYMASYQAYYDLAIDVLMGLHGRSPLEGYDAMALGVSERGRARSLLETLGEARGEIREGVEASLLGRERELRGRISGKEWQLRQLAPGKGAEGKREEAERELGVLLGEYEGLQGEIRLKSPRYAALTQPRPYGLREIQEQVLDEESLLLQYDLGEERSHLWAVTRGGLRSYELPPRKEVEVLARRVYELMVASRGRGGRVAWEAAATELSRMVLGPVSSELVGKRLLVVSDGALQYVPFAALPVPGGRDPLIAEHELVSLPSASVLGVLRRELGGRASAGKAVAVLADPVLGAEDPRVRVSRGRVSGAEASHSQAEARGAGEGSQVTRSAMEAGYGGLPRLPFTRREARSIVALVPGGGAFVALDFEASRETATRAELGEYRIVHFATHGLLNSQHPALSGIVLSLVDEEGRGRDGFLRLQDLYNMRLGADLVVLSACQTALGKEVKGEGLVSMTRGFMYAGAPRVVASLWSVRDEATSELMKRFYRGMLKGGQTPAAALRAAQVSLWREPRFRAPYYWAPFVLQGEWK